MRPQLRPDVNAPFAQWRANRITPTAVGVLPLSLHQAVLSFGLGLFLSCQAESAELEVPKLSPFSGATNVCPDTLLRITFDCPPQLGRSGNIRIQTASGLVVDEINLGQSDAAGAQPRLIGGALFTNYPVIVSNHTAVIYPHGGVLTNGQTYFVNVSPGTFTCNGVSFGITNATTWRFATKPHGPSAGQVKLVVAADGSGDFCSVQGAVDFLPAGNQTPREVFIRRGTYQEIVHVTNKHRVTFRGEDRAATIIGYANNENLNYRGLKTNRFRAAVSMLADDIRIENLTLRNFTPKGGAQAEALAVQGRRCRIRNASFASFQDTLRLDGTVCLRDCYVEGDVDFIWGYGSCFFANCEIRSLTSKSYVTQIRNDANHYGCVFVDCRLTSPPGVSNVLLSRIEMNRFPHSHVAFIDCAMGDHIQPEGWTFTPGTNPPTLLRFWEYRSTDLSGGKPLDVSQRLPAARQLNAAEALQMRDVAQVLKGWE